MKRILLITVFALVNFILTAQNKYDKIYEISNGYARFERDGKFGFIDATTLQEVIPPIYAYAQNFEGGSALVSLNGERVGIGIRYYNAGRIDLNGKVIIPLEYSSPYWFMEGLAAVRKGKWGFIDTAGKIIIPFDYDQVKSFSEGVASVKRKKKWGVIDKSNNVIIPFEYDNIEHFSCGLARVRQGKRYGYINKNGKIVIPIECSYADLVFENGNAIVKVNNNWKLIDNNGKTILELPYDFAQKMQFGLIRVTKKKRMGIIDTTGREILPMKYQEIWNFKENLCAVMQANKWGFIDKTGKTIIPIKHQAVSNFFYGKCTVSEDDEGFYITNPLLKSEKIIDETTIPKRYNTELYSAGALSSPVDLFKFDQNIKNKIGAAAPITQGDGQGLQYIFTLDLDKRIRDVTILIGNSKSFEAHLLRAYSKPYKCGQNAEFAKEPRVMIYRRTLISLTNR